MFIAMPPANHRCTPDLRRQVRASIGGIWTGEKRDMSNLLK